MSTQYQFIPWTRGGAATGIVRTDTLNASLPARVALPVNLRVNERVAVDVALSLYGPGDVTGLDSLQVVRSDPAPWTSDFEPNYFPSIEFDRPDFPWLFTPAAADSQGRLRPWLCLIVIRLQDGVSVDFRPGQPLPVLTIRTPADPRVELPDLSESWAWSHSQVVTSPDGPTVEEHLRKDTAQTVSRLICPRRLEPNARYVACLVPAFAVGVQAGLGLTPDDVDMQALEPAWRADDPALATVTLPVYYQWEFGTSVSGDFETLVRRLQGRPVPAGVGSLPMTANDLGLQLPDGGLMRFDGALVAPSSEPSPLAPPAFQTAMENLLNLPASQLADDGNGPIVAPPIYGKWQASVTRIDSAPGWLRDLNLQPLSRAVAGLGTLVIQDQQEQLMASAWEQLGDLAAERRRLEQPDFARTILHSVYQRRFATLDANQFFQMTAPAHTRLNIAGAAMLAGEPGTLRRVFGNSILPPSLTSGSLRKHARSRSHLFRKLNQDRVRPLSNALMTSGQSVLFQIASRPPPRPASDSVTRQLVRGHVTRLRGVLTFGFPAGSPGGQEQRQVLTRMIDAAQDVRDYFNRAIKDRVVAAPAPVALEPLKFEVLTTINPMVTGRFTARSLAPMRRAAARSTDTPDAFVDGPTFRQPMYEALRDISQAYLLPGAEKIPANTVTLLATNTKFVESYLVGLNHEFSRELLWREYPSEQRHTSFRHFWDDGGSSDSGQIPPLHQWPDGNALGDNFMDGAASNQLVLLIRGELLLRYPNTLIYAVKAESRNALSEQKLFPAFFGTLKPDMSFVGFDLTAAAARGEGSDPGWFFVIEQQPTEARFGLDEPTVFGRDPAAIGDWNDLSWGDVVDAEAQFKALSHLHLSGRLVNKQIGPSVWAQNGAHMAAITLQRPVRVAIHANDLLAGL